ncbi:helix-turn-helix transcriptional regulator [Nonomuraea sp. NN258]|uniref:helix-turn-helix domain-containing protein n=1 Tax=Nonomuraea antri TaxID=2730852 RepID=UPI0015697F82|nr:helix-turn-helix transcriptional regulator [Nonomuraea antri]NRQ37606.1 helix-turn-helix transcriptional regulator [Nonomuraea antri]
MAQASDDPGRALAKRLRSLRSKHWRDVKITQDQLARALGVSVPLISSWESEVHPKTPPTARLRAYATIFCTERSYADGTLTHLASLRPEEEIERDRLLKDLLNLRRAALGDPSGEDAAPAGDLWRFSDGKPVTLICARLPEDKLARMPYADPDDPDYVELYTYADLDSLLELHGRIRAANPLSEVHTRTAQLLMPDDLTTHLVLLGGIDWNQVAAQTLARLHLPVRQVADWDAGPGGAYFQAGDERFAPVLDEAGRLLEDVALFYRGPNPLNTRRTMTMCNGFYGRGTLGAARALTDPRFRDRNAAYCRERFAGQESFAILMRVSVLNGVVLTPDWTNEESRLFEWSS